MYTSYACDSVLKSANGSPQNSLFTVGIGTKWEPTPNCLVTIGCNDVFNKGPKMKILFLEDGSIAGLPAGPIYVNPEYPIQGRTVFATVKYRF